MGETGFQWAELGVAVISLFITVFGAVFGWLIAMAFKVIFGLVSGNKKQSETNDSRLEIKIDEVEKRIDDKVKEIRDELKEGDKRLEAKIEQLHQEQKDSVHKFTGNDREHYKAIADLSVCVARIEEKIKPLTD